MKKPSSKKPINSKKAKQTASPVEAIFNKVEEIFSGVTIEAKAETEPILTEAEHVALRPDVDVFPTATAEVFTNLKAAAFRNVVEIVPAVDARFAELDRLITEAASVAPPIVTEAKPKAPKPPKSKFEGSGKKLADGTSWPAPGGWGSAERPYSSLISMQNDCRNYKRTLEQYREIGADGVAGSWIILIEAAAAPEPEVATAA